MPQSPNPPLAETGQADAAAADSPGLIESALALWGDWREIAHERIAILFLEARRAGESMVVMLLCGIAAGLLLAGAWIGISVALAWFLIERGLAGSAAVFLAALCNLVGALAFGVVMRRRAGDLQFPATMRGLRAIAPAQTGAGPL